MANYEAKLKVLFGNEAFVQKFAAITDPASIKPLAAEFGVELTDEELAEVINAAAPLNDELDEAALSTVSGGIFGVLGAMLGASWNFAVKTYGSPEKAIQGIGSYWVKKFSRK